MAARAHHNPWERIQASIDYWTWLARMTGIWWTRSAGRTAIAAAGRQRFDALVGFARERSPFYREAYRRVPAGEIDPSELPVVTKRQLMTCFDDWVTDPEVTLAGVEAFLADRERIGELYLDRYVLWTSSGSTGEPGIYVQDRDALATYDALLAVDLASVQLAPPFPVPLLARSGRAALVAATGGHYASIASWRHACDSHPWTEARAFSILDPLPRLVGRLNDYQPAFLASYPTMLALLAEERVAGRLRIDPLHLWSGGECLAANARTEIERAFGCAVVNEYGASECMSIAFGCREGWLHVNADCVLIEPIDEDYRPTPPGVPSHTALLTNLANRVQPIIRYDLGDSVLAKPGPCACGSPLPAIQVEGRHDDVVSMSAPDGRIVRLLPLALTTVVEEAAHVRRFQIVQTAADRLMLRLDPAAPYDRRETCRAATAALRRYLAQQALPNVHVGLDKRRPVADRQSGKLREVVAMKESAPMH